MSFLFSEKLSRLHVFLVSLKTIGWTKSLFISRHLPVRPGIPNQNIDLVESTNLSYFLPSGRGFKIAGLNINSLSKHIDELRILLADCSIDILSINKTKLDDTIKSCEA